MALPRSLRLSPPIRVTITKPLGRVRASPGKDPSFVEHPVSPSFVRKCALQDSAKVRCPYGWAIPLRMFEVLTIPLPLIGACLVPVAYANRPMAIKKKERPMTDQKKETIKQLNDQCRQQYMIPQFGRTQHCCYRITPGIQALSPENQIIVGAMVREFDDFSEGNDPYQEHDFGAFDFEGQKIFWKIDYYDTALDHGSEDPADIEQTCRVLTIMLASEY